MIAITTTCIIGWVMLAIPFSLFLFGVGCAIRESVMDWISNGITVDWKEVRDVACLYGVCLFIVAWVMIGMALVKHCAK